MDGRIAKNDEQYADAPGGNRPPDERRRIRPRRLPASASAIAPPSVVSAEVIVIAPNGKDAKVASRECDCIAHLPNAQAVSTVRPLLRSLDACSTLTTSARANAYGIAPKIVECDQTRTQRLRLSLAGAIAHGLRAVVGPMHECGDIAVRCAFEHAPRGRIELLEPQFAGISRRPQRRIGMGRQVSVQIVVRYHDDACGRLDGPYENRMRRPLAGSDVGPHQLPNRAHPDRPLRDQEYRERHQSRAQKESRQRVVQALLLRTPTPGLKPPSSPPASPPTPSAYAG